MKKLNVIDFGYKNGIEKYELFYGSGGRGKIKERGGKDWNRKKKDKKEN